MNGKKIVIDNILLLLRSKGDECLFDISNDNTKNLCDYCPIKEHIEYDKEKERPEEECYNLNNNTVYDIIYNYILENKELFMEHLL